MTKKKNDETNATPVVVIDLPGIATRAQPVPVPPGNYSGLGLDAESIFVISQASGLEGRTNLALMRLEITNQEPKLKTLAEPIKSFECPPTEKSSHRKQDSFYIVDADAAAPVKLEKSVDLKDWTFPLDPRQEWRQMFVEAWRLERDFFYDRHMHGVDWPAMLKKFLPAVDRVTGSRGTERLSSPIWSANFRRCISLFLAAIFVRRRINSKSPTLGARLIREPAADGYRIEHIYQSDPDYPERLSPLARPGVDIHDGRRHRSHQRRVRAFCAGDPATCCATRPDARSC